MEFVVFAEHAAAIEDESADLEIRDRVVELLTASEEDLPIVARFVQGRIVPAWESTTLDIGPALCYAALARAAGPNVSAADVEDRLADVGEIGEVAASYEIGGQRGLGTFGSQGDDGLTVSDVYDRLRELAAVAGEGSEGRKLDILFGLFNRCSSEEARYLARLVLSEMRIGVGSGTVRDAIARAFDVPVEPVERALQVSNDHGLVAETARDDGLSGLDAIHLEIGRPVQSMLAQAGTVTDALTEWEEVGVEWKYDGARIQAHYDGTSVELYSRNLETVTDPLPEVVEFLETELEEPAIIDGEVVAVDAEGAPLPFQAVLRRFRRKYDVEATREEVELEPHFFDCLHVAGEDLLDRRLRERHDKLSDLLASGVSELHLETDPVVIEEIEAAALEAGHEGIMLKNPDSVYSPGRRGKNWLKRKPDVESLDLVVTGAEWGEGRRATFLGTYELSVRDGGEYETIGNVATGITDGELAELTERFEPYIRYEEGTYVDLEPEIVFEVGYEEIQRSPTYSSGYALRFPRFLGVRDDKDPTDADTLERIERLVDDP